MIRSLWKPPTPNTVRYQVITHRRILSDKYLRWGDNNALEVMMAVPVSRWWSARLRSAALEDEEGADVSEAGTARQQACSIHSDSTIVCVMSDRQRLFTWPWKKNKTPTNRRESGKERPTSTRTLTIPVVFFLLTVLSALCRFCEDVETKTQAAHLYCTPSF